MEKIDSIYGENLVFVFSSKYVKDKQPLVIIKDDTPIIPIENCIIKHYSEDFESLVTIKLPTKNRRKAQMISLSKSLSIINKVPYGVLSFTYEDVPYSVGLNHVFMNQKLYFHSAKTGFKLHAIEFPVSYIIIDDLGINEAQATHNHESVAIQGKMKIVSDITEKEAVLKELMLHLAPTNHKEITTSMIEAVTILELDIQYVHGKSHIRY